MSRLSTKAVRSDFEGAILTALRIYAPVRDNCVWNYESINESSFHPRVAMKIVGLSFLCLVTAWEEYLEHTFLRYMAGAESQSSYAPKLRLGKCKNSTHALQVLTGCTSSKEAPRHTRWSDYKWVCNRASIFFHHGEPFSRISPLFAKRLEDAQVIRNRVAHSSPKARRQFKEMTNTNVGVRRDTPLDHGFSPGKYLIHNDPEIIFERTWIDSKECHWGDIFECYVNMFWDIIEQLTPDQ